MEIGYIYLIIFAVFLVLGILTHFGYLNIIIERYSAFQHLIRKKNFKVDKKKVSKYYETHFYFFSGTFLISSIIALVNFTNATQVAFWIVIGTIIIGVVAFLYLNITKRFLIFEE